MLYLFSVNILVALSAFSLAKKLAGNWLKADFLLSWFTLFMAQIVAVELILGSIGKLYLSHIFLLHLIILLFVLKTCGLQKKDLYLELKDFVSLLKDNKILFALSVFCIFFSVKTIFNLVNPPICPDSMQYHLSFPAYWLKNANLDNPIVIFGSRPSSAELTAMTYYPINAELLFFWLLAPLRNAFLADIGEAPFYLIGIIAIYSILRKFAVRRETAFFAGLLWVLIPNLFKQMRFGSQIDVLCATLILLALNFMLLLWERFDFRAAILFGISCAMLLGTKLTNLFWLVSLLPLFGYIVYRQAKALRKKEMLFGLLLILGFTFLLGGFSYLRTYLNTGNPFYPVRFLLLGKEVFPGFIDKDSFSRIFVDWDEFRITKFLFSEGLGAQLFVFILPGTFIPLALTFANRKKFKDPLRLFYLSCAPFIMVLLYFFVIKAFWARYLFPYLGIGLLTMVIFLTRFKWGERYIGFFGMLCVLASVAELAHRRELILSIIASVLLFLLLLFFRKQLFSVLNRKIGPLWMGIIISGIFILLFFLNERYDRQEFSRYFPVSKKTSIAQKDIASGWKWLNDNTGAGRRVAYTGRSEFYPFFGTKLKNDVFYVSVNDKPPLPHYYSDGLYRREKSFEAWLRNLKQMKAELLFVALPHKINNESSDPRQFPIEDRWAAQHPADFQLLFSNSVCRIYKVLLTDKQASKQNDRNH